MAFVVAIDPVAAVALRHHWTNGTAEMVAADAAAAVVVVVADVASERRY